MPSAKSLQFCLGLNMLSIKATAKQWWPDLNSMRLHDWHWTTWHVDDLQSWIHLHTDEVYSCNTFTTKVIIVLTVVRHTTDVLVKHAWNDNMICAPNSLNLNCKVRVMKEAPDSSVSEEIADIFRNYNIDMGLCVFSLPISLVMIERIYTLSYYHHQIGSTNYYPLLLYVSLYS